MWRVLALVLVFASLASAEDFGVNIFAGVVRAEFIAPGLDPGTGKQEVASVSLQRSDTEEVVMCLPAASSERVQGTSELIGDLEPGIWLAAFAHSLPDCKGLQGIPSDDRWEIKFLAPGQVRLVPFSEPAAPKGPNS